MVEGWRGGGVVGVGGRGWWWWRWGGWWKAGTEESGMCACVAASVGGAHLRAVDMNNGTSNMLPRPLTSLSSCMNAPPMALATARARNRKEERGRVAAADSNESWQERGGKSGLQRWMDVAVFKSTGEPRHCMPTAGVNYPASY